jgi:hypothetical protein
MREHFARTGSGHTFLICVLADLIGSGVGIYSRLADPKCFDEAFRGIQSLSTSSLKTRPFIAIHYKQLTKLTVSASRSCCYIPTRNPF